MYRSKSSHDRVRASTVQAFRSRTGDTTWDNLYLYKSRIGLNLLLGLGTRNNLLKRLERIEPILSLLPVSVSGMQSLLQVALPERVCISTYYQKSPGESRPDFVISTHKYPSLPKLLHTNAYTLMYCNTEDIGDRKTMICNKSTFHTLYFFPVR